MREMARSFFRRAAAPGFLTILIAAFYWPVFAIGTGHQAYFGGDFVNAIFPNRQMA